MKSDRLATEQALAAKERELASAKTYFPLNPAKIVSLKQEVKSFEDGLIALDELAEELGLRDKDLETL